MLIITFFFGQVSVSAKLYDFIHFLWLNEAPVGELQWETYKDDNKRNLWNDDSAPLEQDSHFLQLAVRTVYSFISFSKQKLYLYLVLLLVNHMILFSV